LVFLSKDDSDYESNAYLQPTESRATAEEGTEAMQKNGGPDPTQRTKCNPVLSKPLFSEEILVALRYIIFFIERLCFL
jgi:hypothetical protein